MKSAAAAVDAVKQSVSDPRKCTDETVRTLRRLLGLEQENRSPELEKLQPKPVFKPSTGTANTSRSRSRPASKQVNGNANHSQNVALADREKRALATEIVNLVLRNFSTSLNHNRKLNVARCGILAFEELDKASALEGHAGKPHSTQLEKGLVLFANKLASAQLVLEALEVLRLVRKRLLTYLIVDQSPVKTASSSQFSVENIDDLYAFRKIRIDRIEVAEVLSNFQAALLRLAVQHGSPAVAKKLYPHVHPSGECSPSLVCSRRVNLSSTTREKSRKDSETIIDLLETFAARLVSSKDPEAWAPGFALHFAALKNQLILTRVLKTTQDPDHIWDSFEKYLASIAKIPRQYSKLVLPTVRDSYLELQGYFAKLGYVTAAPSSIHMYLSQLALDAGDHQETVRSTVDWVSAAGAEGSSSILICAARIRLAAASMWQTNQDVTLMVKKAHQAVKGQLSGKPSEFTTAFKESLSFRNAYSVHLKDYLTVTDKPRDSNVLLQSMEFLRTLAKFYLKYLGQDPGPQSDTATFASYHQRRDLIMDALAPLNESINTTLRSLLVSGYLSWSYASQVLDDCLHVCDHICADRSPECNDSQREDMLQERVRLRISETCWAYFDCCKEEINMERRVLSLTKSCEVLGILSNDAKGRGSLDLKFHRLGRLLRKAGRDTDASNALGQCLEVSRDLGCLKSIENCASAATAIDPENPETTKIFFSALKSWIDLRLEMFANENEKLAVFDDLSIPIQIRCAVLEWQLRYLNAKSPASPGIDTARLAITRTCLASYLEGDDQLRRKRLLKSYLRHARPHSCPRDHLDLIEIAKDLIDEEPVDSFREGIPKILARHLDASLRLCVGLQEPLSSSQMFIEALSIWAEIDWSDLKAGDVSRIFEDTQEWLQDLHLLEAFFDMFGDHKHLVQTYTLLRATGNLFDQQSNSHLQQEARSRIALVMLDLGYPSRAKILLDQNNRERNLLHKEQEGLEESCTLADARHSYAIGDHQRSIQQFQALEKRNEHYTTISSASPYHDDKLWKAACFSSNEADYLLAYAQSSLETEGLLSAFALAKQCALLLQTTWRVLQGGRARKASSTGATVAPEALNDAFKHLKLDEDGHGDDNVPDETNTPAFWLLVPRFIRAQLLVADLSRRLGMIQDATTAANQALQLSSKFSNANRFDALTAIELAEIGCRTETEDQGRGHLEEAWSALETLGKSKEMLGYYYSLGHHHRVRSELQEEMDAHEAAKLVLEHVISPSFVEDLLGKNPGRPRQNTPPPSGLLQSKYAPTQRAQRDKQPTKEGMGQRGSKNAPAKPETSEGELQETRKRIDRNTAECLLSQESVDKAAALLATIDWDTGSKEELAQVKTAWAYLLVHQAMSTISKDAVLNMVPESSLAYPAVTSPSASDAGGVNLDEDFIGQLTSPDGKIDASVSSLLNPSTLKNGKQARSETPGELMTAAFCGVFEVASQHAHTSSNLAAFRMWSTLATTSIALTLPKFTSVRAALQPSVIAHTIELRKNLAAAREQALVEINYKVRLSKETLSPRRWKDTANPDSTKLSLQNFRSQFIEILPKPWTALSISVSEDERYLYFTRYRSNKEPFHLRLPLSRQHVDEVDQDSDDESDHVFTWQHARETLNKIIAASDETVDQARKSWRDLEKKGAKSKWWSKRETLDHHLHDLLLNMENIWLGGFRGIFSQRPANTTLIARFQKTMENILAKHLPSRQNSKKDMKRITLDRQIWELITNLGDPSTNEDAYVEPLTDLLYFIIDILQFHNEANAYDEVDFDALVVETMDALRSFYEALHVEPQQEQDAHLILVLDKNLHNFPWESMPCLRGKSVSRVPSLIDLRDRILVLREQQKHGLTPSKQAGIHAQRENGACILNPAGDLKKTEKRFKDSLSFLSKSFSWTQITNREPLEHEVESALISFHDSIDPDEPTPPNIMLYFGHGSGLQYVRSKRIKALRLRNDPDFLPSRTLQRPLTPSGPVPKTSDRAEDPALTHGARLHAGSKPRTESTCAAALLFGCSSASLREAGEFEPYGCPKTYLLGGAPAVLGALWDVTDGDVDLFAKGVLTRWGLVPKANFDDDDGQLGKLLRRKRAAGKKKAQNRGGGGTNNVESLEEEEQRPVGLSGAAARSREDCYLKYLNGAAMVVYGVPVYLGEEETRGRRRKREEEK